ncbi:MAG: hypothetical protein ACJA1L_000854 [Paracoccaceae bacterium]|jgi:hypothetical protein
MAMTDLFPRAFADARAWRDKVTDALAMMPTLGKAGAVAAKPQR